MCVLLGGCVTCSSNQMIKVQKYFKSIQMLLKVFVFVFEIHTGYKYLYLYFILSEYLYLYLNTFQSI